jgi:hypothetical protein
MNSAGVAACFSRYSALVGSRSSLVNSALSRSMTGCGVPFGRRHAPPAAAWRGEAGFREGRPVGQERRALGSRDRQRLDLAGAQHAHEVADAHLGDLQRARRELLRDRASQIVVPSGGFPYSRMSGAAGARG